MQLKRFKILTSFRGLPAGYEIDFGSRVSQQKHTIEPLCFVGLNGSGKSNALEAIAEIFYYLETYHQSALKNVNDFRTGFGFEIDYYLPRLSIELARVEFAELTESWTSLEDIALIKIVKEPSEFPVMSITVGTTQLMITNKDSNRNASILPSRVVAYSSGMNELISNPFIKIDFHYFEAFNKKAGESFDSALDMNRMFFMDFHSNELITLCNFLFAKSEGYPDGVKMMPLLAALRIKDLASFSITVQLRTPNNQVPKVPSELNIAIEDLRSCATFHESNMEEIRGQKLHSYKFTYWVNEATKQAFQSCFHTAFNLYQKLYFLNLLNTNLFSRDLRTQIQNAKLGVNLSDLLPKYENNKLLFHIGDLKFSKHYTTEKVFYKQLSDGEHQLMQVMGTLILMDTEGTLFILDEPETHFNPDWRSQFVSLLNECVEKDRKNQEVVLTSHSPFIVSDCQPENVFIFEKDENGVVNAKSVINTYPNFNTYGTSVNLITSKIFKRKETIGNYSLSTIEKFRLRFKDGEDIENLKEEINEELGDSIEKLLLIKEMSQPIKQ